MHFLPGYHIALAIKLLLFVPGVLLAQVDFSSSDVPILVIETNGQEIPDEPRIVAEMGIIDNGEGNRNHVTDPFNGYEGLISIELRGSTSLDFPKKQYAIETQNDDGSNNNVSLLGMPAENDWILHGPYSDKSLMRNMLAYKLSENLGHYAPRTRICELLLNGEYAGVYVLIEKIKQDKNRVDIADHEPDPNSGDELSGGYILKLDKVSGSISYTWRTTITETWVQLEYPGNNESTPEQQNYIASYLDNFEERLYAHNFSDSLEGYRALIDLPSALDYFYVNELAKNVDAYRLSTFFYKDRDSRGGKLCFGPVWDYNIAFANVDYLDGYKADGLVTPGHPWWDRFQEDTVFERALISRWKIIRENEFSHSKIMGIIDSIADVLAESQQRNFQRWDILGSIIWPNYYVGGSFEAELSYLKDWIRARMNWLDDYLNYNTVDAREVSAYETKTYPNPFSSYFTYEFKLERKENISLLLYDFSGKLIASIVSDLEFGPGFHQLTWNSRDSDHILPDGFYAIVMKTGAGIVSKSVIIRAQ
jgi:hypothetical protein